LSRALERGNRRRPDGTPVWPIRDEDIPSRAEGPLVPQQRKDLAVLERRVEATRHI
jgi:hypothetical protein